MPFWLTHSCMATKKAEHCSRFHVEGSGRRRSHRQAGAEARYIRNLIARDTRLLVAFVKHRGTDDHQQYGTEQRRRSGDDHCAVKEVIECKISTIRQLARGPAQ